jgi:hypothetical protein
MIGASGKSCGYPSMLVCFVSSIVTIGETSRFLPDAPIMLFYYLIK